jgi:hypothetical protein
LYAAWKNIRLDDFGYLKLNTALTLMRMGSGAKDPLEQATFSEVSKLEKFKKSYSTSK